MCASYSPNYSSSLFIIPDAFGDIFFLPPFFLASQLKLISSYTQSTQGDRGRMANALPLNNIKNNLISHF